jgi:hypothetical protein
MASFISGISPAAPEPMPWDWNPAATFQTAFTLAQENKRAQEKASMDAELSRILLPERAAKAAFNIKQLAYESKLLEKSYNAQSADYDERMRVISGGGGSADVASAAGATSNPAGGGRYGGQVANILKSYQGGAAAPSSGGGGGKILGTGLNP